MLLINENLNNTISTNNLWKYFNSRWNIKLAVSTNRIINFNHNIDNIKNI